MKKKIPMITLSFILMACSQHTYTIENGKSQDALRYSKKSEPSETLKLSEKLPELRGDGKLSALPEATAFRMSGDYSNNVAVSLAPNGELLYFPAPSDITADSEPVQLVDGWWLNNQGLGPNSVFTNYTFAEYAALPTTPSIEQLKLSIIPGAKVTDFMELPFKIGNAKQNIEEIKNFIKGQ